MISETDNQGCIFKNKEKQKRFAQSNVYWNPHDEKETPKVWNPHFNDAWCIGFVSHIISLKHFKNVKEWINFYYESGEERNNIINTHYPQYANSLNNPMLKYDNKNTNEYNSIPSGLMYLNKEYGRTKKQIDYLGELFYYYLKEKGINVSIKESIDFVIARTLYQTWEGIIERERNTICVLKEKIPNVDFIKTDGEFDCEYAVDYEIKFKDILICGIQIKPPSYFGDYKLLREIQKINKIKFDKYFSNYGKSVHYVNATTKGEIKNKEVFEEIIKDLQTEKIGYIL